MRGRPDGRYPRVRAAKQLYVQYSPEKLRATGLKVDRDSDYAYRCVMDMIYVTGDRLFDDDRILAEITRSTPAKWRKAKAVLLDWGLLRVEDGRITSDEARERLDRLEVQISQKSGAGKASAKSRAETSNPLENNETGPTAVQRPFNGCSPAVGTKEEDRSKDDDNKGAGARAGTDGGPPIAPEVGEAPSVACPPDRDPNDHALIQGFSDAIRQVFGPEHERLGFHNTDEIWARRLMELARESSIPPGKAIDMLRDHFVEQCQRMAGQGDAPPRMLKFFHESSSKLLRRFARDRDMAATAPRPDDGRPGPRRYPGGNGGDAATSTAVRQPWQEVQARLMAAKLFDPARRLSAAAAEGGAAANALAAELEALHLGKKPPAARAA